MLNVLDEFTREALGCEVARSITAARSDPSARAPGTLAARLSRWRGSGLRQGYASADFEAAVERSGALLIRPARRDEPPATFNLSSIRQRIESVYQTLKTTDSGARAARSWPASPESVELLI